MRCVRTALRACSRCDRHFARIHRIRAKIQRDGMVLPAVRLFRMHPRTPRARPFRTRREQSQPGVDRRLAWDVADFAAFADTVGREYACGEPLNLYCHSMGGGIGAAVLERYPALFRQGRAVRAHDRPRRRHADMDRTHPTGALCGLGFGKARVFGHTDFSPELDLDEHKGASEARVRWFHKQRVDDVACQTNATTFEWAHQAMALSSSRTQTGHVRCDRNSDAAVPSGP